MELIGNIKPDNSKAGKNPAATEIILARNKLFVIVEIKSIKGKRKIE